MSDIEEPRPDTQADSLLAEDTPDLVQDAGSQEDDDADLFGDDDDEDVVQKQRPERALDDEELDSGDDLNRDDRVATTVEEDEDEKDKGRPLRILACDVPRINYPEGDEFYLLNMPAFLGIEQKCFDPETYKLPEGPHDGDKERQTSAFSTAMSSIFWRYDPADQSQLQSSARFVRWSDGSLTLQLATKPTEQYSVNALPMRQDFNKQLPPGVHYDPSKDSLTYLAAAHSTPVIDLQLVHRLDATMKIAPSGGTADESELRLRNMLRASQVEDPLSRMKELKEDPELARKAAEQFEKERIRAQRKRENAEERLTMKRNNVLGRGLGGGRAGGGLSVAGLEDDMGMPVSRGKKKQKGRRVNRHGEIYSDDEDETMPRGRTREDEYDRADDFVADSDEEPEQYGDGDSLLDDEEEEDDELDRADKQIRERPRKERAGTPKRRTMDEIDDDDAEGEPDDELLRQSPQQARKKRRVIDDEEDEAE